MLTDVTMLSGRELWICHRSLLVDLSFSASLFYVRENKLVGHKVLIFFKSGLCAFMGTAVNCTASWMAAAEAWAQGDELR